MQGGCVPRSVTFAQPFFSPTSTCVLCLHIHPQKADCQDRSEGLWGCFYETMYDFSGVILTSSCKIAYIFVHIQAGQKMAKPNQGGLIINFDDEDEASLNAGEFEPSSSGPTRHNYFDASAVTQKTVQQMIASNNKTALFRAPVLAGDPPGQHVQNAVQQKPSTIENVPANEDSTQAQIARLKRQVRHSWCYTLILSNLLAFASGQFSFPLKLVNSTSCPNHQTKT